MHFKEHFPHSLSESNAEGQLEVKVVKYNIETSTEFFFKMPGGGFHTRRWRFLCKARWSEREKLRSQSGHWKGLTPVCLRKCLVSSSERANFHVQPSHMHL